MQRGPSPGTPLPRDERGSAGFVAAWLVAAGILAAAFAAAFLLRAADTLRDGGQEAADGASDAPLGPWRVVRAHGAREGERLVALHLLVSVAPAAGEPVRLAAASLGVEAGEGAATLAAGPQAGPGSFSASPLRDADGSLGGAVPSMNRGDLLEIVVDLAANGLSLAPRGEVRLTLALPGQEPGGLTLRAPPSFGAERFVELA